MKKGVLSAAAAYLLWGFFPIYFKAIHNVPSTQVTANRIVWSFGLLLILAAIMKEYPTLRKALKPRVIGIYAISGTVLAINWLTYVWAVSAGYVLEASLGYFINPLVSVLFGVIFLKERLRPMQWVPVGLAAVGVTYLTVSTGKLPWISLVLAVSFGLYGLMKKIAPLPSLPGLVMETGAIFLPALAFLLVQDIQGVGALFRSDGLTDLLLALTGIVTVLPLLLFTIGARRVPLTTVGLLQYFTPTIQFFLGVFLYGEAFTLSRVIGFSIIWVALIIFSVESFTARRRTVASTAAAE
jgi:chloramphenicol-sensitive protein RarD